MVKYRDHRSTLSDSMKTVREICSMDDLRDHLESTYIFPGSEITVKPYGYDKRINWNTYIVCMDGQAVGFTDGPLDPSVRTEIPW